MKTTTEWATQEREAQLNADEIKTCSKYRGHVIVLVETKDGYTGYFVSPDDMDSFGRVGQNTFSDPRRAIEDAKARLDAELTILELDG